MSYLLGNIQANIVNDDAGKEARALVGKADLFFLIGSDVNSDLGQVRVINESGRDSGIVPLGELADIDGGRFSRIIDLDNAIWLPTEAGIYAICAEGGVDACDGHQRMRIDSAGLDDVLSIIAADRSAALSRVIAFVNPINDLADLAASGEAGCITASAVEILS